MRESPSGGRIHLRPDSCVQGEGRSPSLSRGGSSQGAPPLGPRALASPGRGLLGFPAPSPHCLPWPLLMLSHVLSQLLRILGFDENCMILESDD